jgi:hypothetical protein
MKRSIFLFSLLSLATVNTVAQKWESESYLNERNEPSGMRMITQKVEGLVFNFEEKKIVTISRDVPSFHDFVINVFNLDGSKWNSEPDEFIVPESYRVFRSKIGEKISSFFINKRWNNLKGTYDYILDYPKINTLLVENTEPIECVIGVELVLESDGSQSIEINDELIFTLYPSNYKQLVH